MTHIIAADNGIDTNSVALFRVLLAYAAAEGSGTVIQASGIANGDQTGLRQLLDAMG